MYATSLMGLAAARQSQGRHAEALDLREKALAFRRRVLSADHPDIASAMNNKASSYSSLGRHAEALDLNQQMLAFVRRVLPADHPDIAKAMSNTASSYCALGRHAEALGLREKALAFWRRVLPADHPDIASAMNNTAGSYCALGRHAEALDLNEQTLAFWRRVLPTERPNIAMSLLNLAATLAQSAAIWFVREALHILQSQFSAPHPHVIHISSFIPQLKARHGAAGTQPLPPPSSPHLRIGRLVRLHGLSTNALNGRQALVFGPEENGRVTVWLVEASAEVKASLGWGRGVEKAIKSEILLAFHA